MIETLPPSSWAPLLTAWQGMVQRLFRTATTQVWIGLGFTAWLAHLGESGVQVDVSSEAQRLWSHPGRLQELWQAYATWIIAGASLIVILSLLLSLVLLWLRCRGAFMFLDNVLRKDHQVVQPWHRAAVPAKKLFLWSLGLLLVMAILLGLALTPLILWGLARVQGTAGPGLPLSAGLSIPLLILWVLAQLVIAVTVSDLVVPLMYRHQLSVGAAWHRVGELWRMAPQAMAGYLGVRALLGILLGLAVFAGGCLTCCCLWVVLMVPLLWAIILLPALLLVRLYSLEFLRQFGPRFDPWYVSTPPLLPPDVPSDRDQGSNPATT